MKPSSLIFTEEVENDITAAYKWYEEKQVNLGEKFLSALEDCFDSIRINVLTYAIQYKSYRQASVKPFPFVAIYEVIDDQAIVLAVFHTSLNPKKKPS